jgi:hypothetical protein
LAQRSRGLSGADLKSVVEEGEVLYARALVTGRECIPVEQFFLRAIENSLRNRRSYGRGKRIGFGAAYGFQVE